MTNVKILKFYTDTCMPCKALTKILSKIEGVEIEPINANEDVAKVNEYNICATPTLIFLCDGEEFQRTHGLVSESKIKEIIDSVKMGTKVKE